METYLSIFIQADGEKASVINQKLLELDLKPTLGEHDYVYNWNGIVTIEEEMKLIDKIQDKLKGTGAILKFKTLR